MGVVDGNVDIHVGLTFADIDRVLRAHDQEYDQRLRELTAKVNALGNKEHTWKEAAVPEEVVNHILSVLRDQRVPQMEWAEKLTYLTHEYAVSRSDLRSLKAADTSTRRLLAKALDTRDPRLADELLMEAASSALDHARKAKREATQFSREAAQMTVCRASLAQLNLDSRGAAMELEAAFGLRAGDIDTHAVSWLLQAGDLLLHAGDSRDATRLYQQALEESLANSGRNPSDVEWRISVANSEHSLGMALIERSNFDEAQTHLQQSLRIRSELVTANPTDPVRRRELLFSHKSLATVWLRERKIPEAIKEYDAALEIAVAVVAVKPTEPHWQRDLLEVTENIAEIRQELGADTGGAIRTFNDAIAFAKQTLESDPSSTEWRLNEAIAQEMIGRTGIRGNDPDIAAKAQKEALRIYDELASEHPEDPAWRSHQMTVHGNNGLLLMQLGQPTAAIAEWRIGLQLAQGLLAADPTSVELQLVLSRLYADIGDGFAKLNNTTDALTEYKTAGALLNQLASTDPTASRWQLELWENDVRVAKQFVVLKHQSDALQRFEQALARARNLAGHAPSNGEMQSVLLQSLEYVGDSFRQAGNRTEALNAYNAAAEIARRYALVKDSGSYWRCHLESVSSSIGQILMEQGNFVLAARQYNRAIRTAEELVAADPLAVHWQTKLYRAWAAMGDLNVQRHRDREALESFRNSLNVAKRLLEVQQDDTLILNAALLSVSLIRLNHVGSQDDQNLLRRGVDASRRLRAAGDLNSGEQDMYVRRMQSLLADWPEPGSRNTLVADWTEQAANAIRSLLAPGTVPLRINGQLASVSRVRLRGTHLIAKVDERSRQGLCANKAGRQKIKWVTRFNQSMATLW